MSEYNDGQYNSFYRTDPQSPGRQSTGYAFTRRTPRYSRASNPSSPSNPSWISGGMLSPPTFGAAAPSIYSTSSRPLPMPLSSSPSRVMSQSGISDFQPVYPSPSDAGREADAQSNPGPPTSELRDDREWEAEENMTIGQSANEEHYGNPPEQEQQLELDQDLTQGQFIPEDEPYVYPIAPEVQGEPGEPKKSRRKNFVGGFVSGLRKIPKAMVRSHFHDRKPRKDAFGTEQQPTGGSNYLPAMEQPTGSSNYLPAYDDPGTTVPHPESVHYVQGTQLAGPQRTPTELSYVDVAQRTSQPRASQARLSHRSSSHGNAVSEIGSSPRFRSPLRSPEAVLADPLPASDYAKMDSPIRMAPPADSFSAHITHVNDFFHQLKSLPWTSDRVALDYVPTRSPRAHVGKSKPKGSWYDSNRHQEIDLLAGPTPTTPSRPNPFQLRSEDGRTSASIRSAARIQHEGRTPASYMTSPGLVPSPGASSHGQGQHMMSYSYYFTPPQPLYVYQSPMTSPMTHHSSSSSSDMQPQAVPVYMMAGPPPGLIPTAPPAIHPAQHNQAARAASPPTSVNPARPASQRRHSRQSSSNVH